MQNSARDIDAMTKEELKFEVKRLTKILNTPLYEEFVEAVKAESAHQLWRWEKPDNEKNPQDWFDLIRFLSGKALRAHIDGNRRQSLHHTVSSAAALMHWHQAIVKQTTKP